MLVEKINEMIANAIKTGEKVKLNVYRSIKTAFINYQTAKAGNIIDDVIEIQIISKLVAQRKDSIEQYNAAGREDLANAEQAELDILMIFMPKEATSEDISKMIDEFIANNDNLSMKNMKDVMSFIKSKYPTANGGIISKIFVEKLKNI